jgi:hypothetical protein
MYRATGDEKWQRPWRFFANIFRKVGEEIGGDTKKNVVLQLFLVDVFFKSLSFSLFGFKGIWEGNNKSLTSPLKNNDHLISL